MICKRRMLYLPITDFYSKVHHKQYPQIIDKTFLTQWPPRGSIYSMEELLQKGKNVVQMVTTHKMGNSTHHMESSSKNHIKHGSYIIYVHVSLLMSSLYWFHKYLTKIIQRDYQASSVTKSTQLKRANLLLWGNSWYWPHVFNEKKISMSKKEELIAVF